MRSLPFKEERSKPIWTKFLLTKTGGEAMLVAHNLKEENMQKTKDAKRRRPPKPFAPGGYELFHNGLYRQKIIPDKKKAEKRKRKKVDMREYQPFFVGVAVGSFPLFKNSGI